ncbi:3-hydroxyanthranilate 3,4-dioxygenase-like [Oopsacas minuta]|uniref:3-hydroxyanthranilate 3,4-dioxygenase n=1 Tax=Oopsacas minuta TaxID=111878 RepID=A0AAV7JMM6_9METZ|nr:3-hydroxyanthranilate 3,4-dioxygenase-like [Oopsacas minuta]
MAASDTLLFNIPDWITTNEPSFVPPVCNKLMHGAGQLKIMFIGGPNVRKDYHMEEGEELFYQIRGDMVLKIVEKGQHKDIVIKEGEMFQLPSRIPHSPQRQANTVGLVVERERYEHETDGLRYYQEGSTDILWEKWFYCYDLGKQLGPVIGEYFASEEHKTGQPPAGRVFTDPPIKLDVSTEVTAPMTLNTYLSNMKHNTTSSIFGKGELRVEAVKGAKYGPSTTPAGLEAFIWVLEGSCKATVKTTAGTVEVDNLKKQDSLLVTEKCEFWLDEGSEDLIALIITMDPKANK